MDMNYLAVWVIGLAIAVTVATLVIRWFVHYVYDTYDYSVIDWPSLIILGITMILSGLIVLPLAFADNNKVFTSRPDTRCETPEGRAILDAANTETDAALTTQQAERQATANTNFKITLWFNVLVMLAIFIRNGIKTSWVCAAPITIMQIAVVTVMVPIIIYGACKAGDITNAAINGKETIKQFERTN